ncbi:protein mono-ADP-ribosyltransferase PARP9-like [Carassius carassius]|uniref:protein mono-ADP-ribosyltransferase PARP9-like n=1 Tax=Carassius carassius TaxID=217509 RepID=UPI00286917CC|nr:protein mono-ADP-ribosyltransferase PARP9-like [Carassius carassius]XP_059355986.1 protein mono-ADP-ribosyltransferase PARP9-like [Carassius carassius]XP_059355987.1 protein mono-ADP-ribosyltransferase PARP9-like [Carassius carassius]
MSDKEQGWMPLVSEQAAVLARCGEAFCHAVNVKFNCTAILRNVEEAGSFGSSTSGVWRAEKRYSTKLSSGVEVSVWKDDLTRHKVEAVVNAANEKLNHGGGLAQALCTAGGPMIQKWSHDIIQKNGRVKVGEAVYTSAGDLPCKYIIHAVGPCLSPNPSKRETDQAAPYLYNAINSILHIVLKENISSVAIPALSSGLFHFPRDRCADIIVKAIKQFDECTSFQSNLEIHLVNNDEPSVQEMERAVKAILVQSSISGTYSGAVQSSMALSLNSKFQFWNVTLQLKTGAIEEEKVHVIVNTISEDCNLSMGLISKAILNKAGRKIQDEISRGKHSYSTNVHVTKGHNLNCQAVYHTVCVVRSDPMATQILYNVVSECLWKASMVYKSISFPAIGTGNLGFKKSEVARIMTDAVANFAKSNMKKLDVNFVVYPKDKEMMEAFENEMKTRNEKAKAAESPVVYNDIKTNFAFAASETTAHKMPSVEFDSVSREALREAKEWTTNMLKPSDIMTIKNNHVIYLGQDDHASLLSLQTMLNVCIEEFFRNGKGGITITGNPSNVSCAAIEVESMLCKAQEEFAQAEERDMLYSVVRWSCKDVPWIQTPEISADLEKAYLAGNVNHEINTHKVNLIHKTLVDDYGRSSNVERTCLLDRFKSLNNSFYSRTPETRNDYFGKEAWKAFNVVKKEKIENIALKQLFKMNMQRLNDKPKCLYQRVSAQFCDLICRVGFQKVFAPPAEQRYGSGIYFSSTVDGAMKLWKDQEHEQYIYIIQAQVLTGKSTIGSPHHILPPPLHGDPLDCYDSLSDMVQTYVIFNGQQALPEYLIIYTRPSHV